jgi:hypothetical protein
MGIRLTSVAIAIALGGCATNAKFQERMNSWIGSSEAALVSRYGPPNASYTLQDGGKVLQYTKGDNIVIGGGTVLQPVTSYGTGNVAVNSGGRTAFGTYNQTTTTYVTQQQPAYNVQRVCTVNFTLSPDGTVVRWDAEGNHCVSK